MTIKSNHSNTALPPSVGESGLSDFQLRMGNWVQAWKILTRISSKWTSTRYKPYLWKLSMGSSVWPDSKNTLPTGYQTPGRLLYKKDGSAPRKFWKEPLRATKTLFCGRLELFKPLRGTNSKTLSSVIFFWLNTLKVTVKFPAVDLFRQNTNTAFLEGSRRFDEHPVLLIWVASTGYQTRWSWTLENGNPQATSQPLAGRVSNIFGTTK